VSASQSPERCIELFRECALLRSEIHATLTIWAALQTRMDCSWANHRLQRVVGTRLGSNVDVYMRACGSPESVFWSKQETHFVECRWCVCSVVIQQEDEEGKIGVKIGRELMNVAATALKTNITRLAPLVLPVSEQLIFAGNFVARKVRPKHCLQARAILWKVMRDLCPA